MEFPFGHHHHHSHHRRDDEEDSRRFPEHPPPPFGGGAYPHAPPPETYPPPSFGSAYPPPDTYAPPPVSGVYHSSHTPYQETPAYAPPPVSGVYQSSHTPYQETPAYAPPPPAGGVISHVHHSGHESGHHNFHPHMPSFISEHVHSHGDGSSYGGEDDGPLGGYFRNKPTFKLYCKAGGDRYAVAIRDDQVVLVQQNSDDPAQHWYKDEKFSTKVKDADGYPSFALVNKATGQAIKHSLSGHPVKLVPYNPDELDSAILWTESKDLGHGFRTIRMVNNVKLVMDAFHGDKDHGGVHDGTIVALYESWKGDNQNQQWKLSRYCKLLFPYSNASQG